MTIKLNTTTTLLLIVGILVLLFFVIRGCNNNPVNTAQKTVDSINAVKKENERLSGIVIDSLVSVINKRGNKEDALKKANNALIDQLEVKSLTANELAKEVQLYSKYKDTVELLRAAPLLADEVIGLSEKIDEYKKSTHELLSSLDSTKGATTLLLMQKDNMYRNLNNQFNFLAASYSSQGFNLTKEEKKASKRIVIGPQIGATFINGKPDVYLGIGATYRLIRL